VYFCCHWLEDVDDVAVLDEAMLKSESRSLVFLNELVGVAPRPMHRTLLECSEPNTLPITSLGETSYSSLVLWVKYTSICSYRHTTICSENSKHWRKTDENIIL